MRSRVMVVDDDRATVRLLADMLSPDYDVIAVSDHFGKVIGADFYDHMEAAIVDLLLGVDVTGCEILTFLHNFHPHVRRIAMTAARDNGATNPCPAAQHTLLKPFHEDEVRGFLAA